MAKGTIQFPEGSYSGEVLDHLLKLTANENETYKKGLIHVETDIRYKLTLPTATIGRVIQPNVPTPDVKLSREREDGFNTIKIAERTLEPKDFMIFKSWYPEAMASYWKPFQPFDNLLFRELDPDVQADFVSLVLDEKNRWIGQAIWQSVAGGEAKSGIVAPEGELELGNQTDDFSYFDGAIKRIVDSFSAENDIDKAVQVGDALLDSGEAVENALYAIYRQVPDNMRSQTAEMSYIVSYETWLMYDEYASKQGYKYIDNTLENKRLFKGSKIIPVAGVPNHTIVYGKFNNSQTSNLWMGIDWASERDEDVFKIGNLYEFSAEKFIQMRMKMDVNIVRPSEILVHTAYKKKTE